MSQVQVLVDWLTAQPQVHWVSPRPKIRAANFFATGIGQSGNAATLAAASNGPGAANDGGTHPLWDAGGNLLSASPHIPAQCVDQLLPFVCPSHGSAHVCPGTDCSWLLLHDGRACALCNHLQQYIYTGHTWGAQTSCCHISVIFTLSQT